MAQGSKCQILPCCIRLLLDYLLSSLSVKHIHYLHKAYICLGFCLSHFLSGGPLVPRGLLDVLLIKKKNNIVTTVYPKATTNDIYLNWMSSAPTTWKRGTLETLVDHPYLICSSIAFRKKEIDHLKKVFHESN